MARSDWSGYVTCGCLGEFTPNSCLLRTMRAWGLKPLGLAVVHYWQIYVCSRLQKTGGRFRNLFLVSWWLTPSFVHIYRISLHSVMAGLWVKLVSRILGSLYDPFTLIFCGSADFLGRAFLSHRRTPSHHPFLDGIFPSKPSIFGYPHGYGNPLVEDPKNLHFPGEIAWFCCRRPCRAGARWIHGSPGCSAAVQSTERGAPGSGGGREVMGGLLHMFIWGVYDIFP